MLMAITKEVSPAMNRCELSYLNRVEIDVVKAAEQHMQYEACLRAMGADVIALPAEPEMPDSVFVEDPAVVVDEVAIMTRPGAESRRREGESLAKTLARFRPLRWMQAPATLEGGDVMRAGRTLYVGASARSNPAGIEQLALELTPYGYAVRAVEVRGCLHLKSGCCYLGDGIVLANREWADTAAFGKMRIVDVALDEPWAANVLTIGGGCADARRISSDSGDCGGAGLEGANCRYLGTSEGGSGRDLLQPDFRALTSGRWSQVRETSDSLTLAVLWAFLIGRGGIAEFDLGDRSAQADRVDQFGVAGVGGIDGRVLELLGSGFHLYCGAEAVALGVCEHGIGAIQLHW